MLVSAAITAARAVTGQVFDSATLVRWLSELDAAVAFEFFGADAWAPYDPETDMQHELLLPFPWDRAYVHHLEEMTYYSNGEYDRVENARQLCEQAVDDFRKFVRRTHRCVCKELLDGKTGGSGVTVIGGDTCTGAWFYLSAYAEAVKHGFSGTPEEWLDSLMGEPGPEGPAGPQGPQGVQGAQGPPGEQGMRGEKGEKGDTGDTGATGPQGPQGQTGPQGQQGERGPQGEQGEAGPTGPTGPTGAAAGFGTVSATITDDGGGPAVSVETSGPDTAKNFSFEFQNIGAQIYPPISAEGDTVSFETAAAAPINPLLVDIQPVQAGSGDPSPENVRPITGWTGATVTVTDGDSQTETVTVEFPTEAGTVYGGTLDVTRGVLTVTHGYFQLTSNNVALSGNIVYWPIVLPYAMIKRPGICSHGVVTTDMNVSPRIIIGDGARQVYWIDILNALNLSTLNQFKSWIDTQTVQVVYTLPSPVTYQLTPQQIVALEGVNHISADCGPARLCYRKGAPYAIMSGDVDAAGGVASKESAEDTRRMIAPIEGDFASQNYAVGNYLVKNGLLHRVTSAIASGERIVPRTGGNVAAETVGERLTQDAGVFAVHTRKMHILDQIANHTYEGADLTTKMAAEIAGYSGPWAWLHARIQNADYDELYVCDYIPITLSTGEVVIPQIAGIDTYYKVADNSIGHHIDFISRDCLVNSPSGKFVFNSTNTNNGTADVKNPWLASKLYQTLNNEDGSGTETLPLGVITTLPAELQAVIIQKRALLEERYSDAGAVSADTGRSWQSMGKLWLPTEVEVFGHHAWSEPGFGTGNGGCNLQYPIFVGGAKHIIKGDGRNGSRCTWWEASAHRLNSTNVCAVYYAGSAYGHSASYGGVCAPLCFRAG